MPEFGLAPEPGPAPEFGLGSGLEPGLELGPGCEFELGPGLGLGEPGLELGPGLELEPGPEPELGPGLELGQLAAHVFGFFAEIETLRLLQHVEQPRPQPSFLPICHVGPWLPMPGPVPIPPWSEVF